MLRRARECRQAVTSIAISCVIVALCGMALTGAARAATALEFLQSSINPDGSFGSTATSLATPVQSTAEALRTYQVLGQQSQPPFGPALLFLNGNAELNAEYLARRIVVYAALGADVAADINALAARQNADGGFGDHPGYASSPLDTGYVLEALAAANYTSGNFVAAAVGYLLNKQSAAGGWATGENASSVFVTAQAMRGLRGYRTTYQGVTASLTAAQNFLLAQRAAGQWLEAFETASALLVTVPGITDLSLIGNSAQDLQAAQLPNGSWLNDPYTTALALQALQAYSARQSGAGQVTSGAISGYVLRAGSVEPIVGAQVSLAERAGSSVLTNGDGYFQISNLPAGQYTLAASKTGFLPASGTAQVNTGQVTLAATLVLDVGSSTGMVNGKIFDGADLTALPGSVITLSGATTYSATTDVNGVFSVAAVQPGSYTVGISRTGYQTVNGVATVAGGQLLTVNQRLVKSGAFLNSDPGTISGTVIDARTGAPVVGALFDLGGGRSAISSAGGQFAISGVPRGDYGGTLSAAGYVSQNYTIGFPAGSLGNLGVLALYAASNTTAPTTLTLDGVVVDGVTGVPISGANIGLVETGAVTNSDANGRFQFSGIRIKTFSLTASAGGYETSNVVLQVAAFGQAAVKLSLSPPGTGTATSTLQGSVRDAQTSAPIPNAQVRVVGSSLSTTTDAAGSYELSGIDQLRFDVAVSAVGYAQRTANVQLAQHGRYSLNPVLEPVAAINFQVISVSPNQASSGANATALFTAQVASVVSEPRSALVVGEVLDANGTSTAVLMPYAEGTTIPASLFNFGASEVKSLTLPWSTGQLAPGNYTVIVRVVEPGTISRERPLGQVLAENSTTASVVAAIGIGGGIVVDPPLTQAGATTPVGLSALIQNTGNVALEAGNYQLSITHPDTGASLYVVQAAADRIEPGAHTTVSFGTWIPTTSGNLNLRVRSLTDSVPGEIADRLYVGDKATGTFTVDKNVVREGTSAVRGKIGMQGVDVRQGTSTDPLFALVREAVRRGGLYTGPAARSWHTSSRCLGCHIQTQSQLGLASSLDKAPIDRSQALFLYNAIASSQQANGSTYISHPEFQKAQSYLGIWSLGAWPVKEESFRTQYKLAKYVYDTRIGVNSTTDLWRTDHSSGWWYSDVANTALALSGFTDVLRASGTIDLSAVVDHTLGPAMAMGSGGDALDIELGPDGALYVTKYSGRSVNRVDLVTGQATTVVSGLPNNAYGVTFGPDGLMYVSGNGYIIRINADGTRQTLYTAGNNIPLTDIETGPDGLLYVSDYVNNRILRLPTTGLVETFVSGGLLRNPYGLAFDAAGNLLVANYGGYGILAIAPNRAVSVRAETSAFRPVWLTPIPNGDILFSTDAPNGLTRVRPSGVMERLFTANTLRGLVVANGKVYVGNQTANTLHEVVATPFDTSLLATFAAEVPKAARYLLSNYQDNTSDNIVQAMRMIGLGYAREFVTDATLLGQINTAIAYENTVLRSRQRVDGGWGRSQGQASDALVTAMVGLALDYTDPSPDDPLIRRTIQYLLNTQAGDGSWTNANNGLTTRLAATSFVMAYLPKALDRLGGIDVDLHLQTAANVQLTNPSIAPTTTIPVTGGGQEYIWRLLGVTSAGRNVEFDLTLLNMQLNEVRPAASSGYLEFTNSFTTERLQVALAIPTIRAAADMALTVGVDRTNYQPNERVGVTATVNNVGPTSGSGQVLLSVRAPGSAVDLATLPAIPVTDIASGAQITYPSEWNTGTTLNGAYELYGQLIDTQGRLLSESRAPFNIGAPAVSVTTSVTTDKPIYDAWDTVSINGRVQNVAPNAILAVSRVEVTVRSPAGQILLFESRTLGQLLPGALRDVPLTLRLSDAAAGGYTVDLVLKDDFTRTVLSTSATSFEVRRREVQGLIGTVTVQSPRVYIGDGNVCTESAKNMSGGTLTGVKLIHQLINVTGGLVFDEYVETVDLAAGGVVHNYFRNVNTGSIGLGDFSCVIKAEIGGEAKTLAFGGFQVVEPPIRINAELKLGPHGKLLILLDRAQESCRDDDDRDEHDDDHNDDNDHRRGSRCQHGPNDDRDCTAGEDPHGPKTAPDLAAQRQFLEQLLTNAGWTYTIVDTGETFARELKSGAYSAYGLFSEHVKLSTTTQKALREAIFRGEGLLMAGSHDNRNEKLNDILGLKRIGTLSHATRVVIPTGPLGVDGSATLLPGDRINRIKRLTAQTLATYELTAYGSDMRCDDEGDDRETDECDGRHPDTYIDAITLNNYGSGKAVFAGFDLLAQATKDGNTSLSAKTLLGALSASHPVQIAPTLGRVLPVDLKLANRGIATQATVAITIPVGTTVDNAGGGTVTTSATGTTLTFTVTLAVNEEKTQHFSLKLPSAEGTLNLHASITAGNRLITETDLTITVPAISAIDDLVQQAQALTNQYPAHRHALNAAQDDLDKAAQARSLDKAIDYALKATDDLLGITEPGIVSFRQQVDAWIRYMLMIGS